MDILIDWPRFAAAAGLILGLQAATAALWYRVGKAEGERAGLVRYWRHRLDRRA